MNDSDLSAKYQVKTNELIEHQKALVSAARNHLFPVKFKTLDWLPDVSNWTNTQRVLFGFFMPLAILDSDYNQSVKSKSASLSFLSIGTWVFYFLALFASGLISALLLLGSTSIAHSSVNLNPSISTLIFTYVWFIVFFVFGITLYIQTVWYWFNPKTTWISRLLYIGSIAIIGYLFPLEIKPLIIGTGITINISAMISRETWLFSIFFYWIPFILLSASVALNFSKFLLASIFEIPLYFLKAHSTDNSIFIKKILSKPVEFSGEKLLLTSLPKPELAALKEWAQNNLEATEKKTIPATILFALLAIIVSFSPTQTPLTVIVTTLFSSVVSAFQQNNTNLKEIIINFVIIGVTELAVILALLFFREYIRLLGNLFVQGLVIETCTVAEYAKRESEKENAKQNQPRPFWQTFFDGLFSFLKK